MSKVDSHDQSAYQCQFECQFDHQFDQSSKEVLCGFIEGVMIVEKNEQDQSSKALEESKAEIKQIQEKIDSARSAIKSLLQF